LVYGQASRAKLTIFHSTQRLRNFQWGPEQQAAFDALKDHIPKLHTEVILCVSATHTAVSGALVQEREISKVGRKLLQQVAIYFAPEALTGSKKYYSKMEKIYYAVVMSTRKLHNYFKAHRIRFLTNQPLNDIFGNQDCTGRIGKWAMELFEHVVDFEKRSAIKWQVLVDLSQTGWSPQVTSKAW
jgi:hypothetical protein